MASTQAIGANASPTADLAGLRIAVTGGSGEIGGFILRELRDAGCKVTNFDITRSTEPGIHTVQLDAANFGDVVSCLRGYDGIVHLAAVSRPGIMAGHRMFATNTQSTFNILEAAATLRINRIVLASSLNAVGMAFNLRTQVDYLPLDEAHPCRPDEPYGLSKLLGERTAGGFARRYPDMAISSLRLPAVMTPGAFKRFDPAAAYLPRSLWAYADVRAVARAFRLALQVPWRGHEVFMITAEDTASERPSRELAAQHYPGVEIRAALEGTAAMISAEKARHLLGWRHERSFATCLREFQNEPHHV